MFAFIDKIFDVLSPIWFGLIFAFLLAPIYNKLCKHMHKVLASIICLLILLVMLALVLLLILPQLIDSIESMMDQFPGYVKAIDGFVDGIYKQNPQLEAIMGDSYKDVRTSLEKWLSEEVVPNLSSYISTISSGIFDIVIFFKDFIIGLIVMVYMLNIKDRLKAQGKKICYSLFRIEKANLIIEDFRFIHETFSNFIIGKIIDSAIIAVLTFIVITIFRMPYSIVISVFIGITNIIPFFGPFIGAIPCAFLLLLVSPLQCFEFIIIIIVIQQLDGNLIGPKILGERTGVSSFGVLFSILLMGGLFGLVGMIIAVPTCAVVKRWIKRGAEERLQKKQLSIDTKDYMNLESIDVETKEYKNHDITGTVEK